MNEARLERRRDVSASATAAFIMGGETNLRRRFAAVAPYGACALAAGILTAAKHLIPAIGEEAPSLLYFWLVLAAGLYVTVAKPCGVPKPASTACSR